MTEHELEKRLAALGLPDDIDEVLLEEGPAPDPAALARMKARTLALAGAPAPSSSPATAPSSDRVVRMRPTKRPWRQRILAAVAAVALVAVGTMVALGPAEVLARLVSYVPGLGLRDPQDLSLALAKPVRLERGDQWVEVRGLVADKGGITLHIYSNGPALERENVRLELGARQAAPSSSQVSWSHPRYEGWYAFDGAVDGARQATVVVEGAEPWRLTVGLVPGSQLLGAEQFGPSRFVNGYSIAARAQAEETRLDLSLLVQGAQAGSRVLGVERYFGNLPATRTLGVTAAGQQLKELPGSGAVGGQLWHRTYEAVPTGTTITVTVPALEVEEPGEATISLPVKEGPVGKEVTLGRWRLTLVRTELDEKGMTVYVDTGPATATSLDRFNDLEVNGRPVSWSSKHDEETGRMTWFFVPVGEGARSVRLTLKRPSVLVEGPWVIDVPVNP